MKFYDREKEMKLLYSKLEQSKKSACFTVLVGRRRIGKTALLLESYKKEKYFYLFISRKNQSILYAQFHSHTEKLLVMRIFGTITQFRDLFEQLMIYATKE